MILINVFAVGWTTTADPGFGGARDDASVKAKMINLIQSVRTLMRSEFPFYSGLDVADVVFKMRMKQRKLMVNGADKSIIVPLIAINTLIILYEVLVP